MFHFRIVASSLGGALTLKKCKDFFFKQILRLLLKVKIEIVYMLLRTILTLHVVIKDNENLYSNEIKTKCSAEVTPSQTLGNGLVRFVIKSLSWHTDITIGAPVFSHRHPNIQSNT